ncbi:hypothetical protein AcW1_000339 [Taiwanofungus camphoratus]|nr:hypothetical protein AcW2_001166 [Antrodia cinnamomea]KAI0935974.1 hypothetical protein AcV5_004239 [Antrodia cinnamomea]KAI0961192.1 hypothetical protein AcV7_000359 [Antrodia cinnamomea]KAI0963189.1 hypothetical protein AcW1_000339 [Antrodia cinnamomea]
MTSMSFSPKSGCPMCGIVSSGTSSIGADTSTDPNPATDIQQQEILWRDDNITVYKEKVHPVSSKGHIIIVFNLHVPSLYSLSSSDLPLLVSIRDLSYRILSSIQLSTSCTEYPQDIAPPSSNAPALTQPGRNPYLCGASTSTLESSLRSLDQHKYFRVGFITTPFRDSKIPVTDHLHAHAYVLPADCMGWWRSIAFSTFAWYAIDDLIAEIR